MICPLVNLYIHTIPLHKFDTVGLTHDTNVMSTLDTANLITQKNNRVAITLVLFFEIV